MTSTVGLSSAQSHLVMPDIKVGVGVDDGEDGGVSLCMSLRTLAMSTPSLDTTPRCKGYDRPYLKSTPVRDGITLPHTMLRWLPCVNSLLSRP